MLRFDNSISYNSFINHLNIDKYLFVYIYDIPKLGTRRMDSVLGSADQMDQMGLTIISTKDVLLTISVLGILVKF